MSDPLDEIFVEASKMNLTTAKIEIGKLNYEIKRLKSKFSKMQQKWDKEKIILEENVIASSSAINYWINRYKREKDVLNSKEGGK